MPSIGSPDDGDTEPQLLAGIYGACLYSGQMPIALLVAMHSLTILGPTLIKIGYVMRLLAQYRIRGPQMILQTA